MNVSEKNQLIASHRHAEGRGAGEQTCNQTQVPMLYQNQPGPLNILKPRIKVPRFHKEESSLSPISSLSSLSLMLPSMTQEGLLPLESSFVNFQRGCCTCLVGSWVGCPQDIL